MDLNTVTRVSSPRTRADLVALGASTVPLAGGTILFAEPDPRITALVDLHAFDWPQLTVTDQGLEVAATTTIAALSRMPDDGGWAAHALFYQCCTALYGSFKVWNVATIGGNICTALPAGPMTSLFAALDARALIWRADGTDEWMPVADVVTGDTTTTLAVGDVLRSVHVPRRSLGFETAYRKIALSALGRSGAVIIGRVDPADGSFVLTVTAATVRPEQLRFAGIPTADQLRDGVEGIDSWFTDAHGAADWRRSVSGLLGEEIRMELAERVAGR